jgi:hypothetical protein
VVATAAHIADKIPEGTTLFVAGPARPQLVPILGGEIKTTIPLRGNRDQDHSDSAYWRIPADVVENLGAPNFLGPSRLAHNRAALERRYYTALGYAVSRNDPLIDHDRLSIAPGPSMYTSTAGLDPALERKLRRREAKRKRHSAEANVSLRGRRSRFRRRGLRKSLIIRHLRQQYCHSLANGRIPSSEMKDFAGNRRSHSRNSCLVVHSASQNYPLQVTLSLPLECK